MEDIIEAGPDSQDLGEPDAGMQETGFLESLSDDNRALAAEQGWRDAGSVVDGYRALQADLDGTLKVPDEAAGAEEKSAFYRDVSESWTPKEGYRFKMPEALPESFPYDQAFAREAGEWFQEAGLHPEAAQKLHDKWVGKMAEQFAAQEDSSASVARQQVEKAEAAHQALVREYGPPESDGYQNVVAKADRAMSGLKASGVDLSDWFADKGALSQADANGLRQVSDPTAVKLLAFIHDSAFAEDGLSGLADAGGGANPFDRDAPDLKVQSELLERNPARARQLILAAGRKPGLFGV